MAKTQGSPSHTEADFPPSLSEYVVNHLTEALFTGTITPGDRVSPMKLATELGISHIPVREALVTLEASGHVVREPRRGFFVASLSLSDLEDIYHWRRVLEEEANRRGVPRLRDEDIDAMSELNDQMRAADARGDSVGFGHLNRQWHFVPIKRVQSKHIERFLAHLWDAASRYQAILLRGVEFISEVQDQHEDLMKAYTDRDVNEVNRLLDEHRLTTLRSMRDVLAKAEEPDQQ